MSNYNDVPAVVFSGWPKDRQKRSGRRSRVKGKFPEWESMEIMRRIWAWPFVAPARYRKWHETEQLVGNFSNRQAMNSLRTE